MKKSYHFKEYKKAEHGNLELMKVFIFDLYELFMQIEKYRYSENGN